MKRCQALIFAAVLAVCVGCDQTTKRIAGGTLEGSTISLAGDALRLELVHNSGAFLGVGAGLPSEVRGPLLLWLVPLFLGVVCVMAVRAGLSSGWLLLGIGLLVGGGLGNWIDRLMHGGAVTDFMSLGLGPLRTGIFNLADLCIMAGVLLTLLAPRAEDAEDEEHVR
jgi:signal peptidase II